MSSEKTTVDGPGSAPMIGRIVEAGVQVLRRTLKPALTRTVLRPDTVVPILLGPCRGLRYRIFPVYGWAPMYGGWEPEAQRLIATHVLPGDVVYDVGGNYGIHTILFARLVGAEGRVVAFEPLPHLAGALRDNVDLNGFSNVVCDERALADYTGEGSFLVGHHEGAGQLVGPDEAASRTVPVTTVDEVVFGEGQRPPTLVKIDVEGAEAAVLEGARRVLDAHGPTLLIDLHNVEQDVGVGRVLADLGYVAFRTESGAHIKDLGSPWPDPDGIWGQIIAFQSPRRPNGGLVAS